MTEPVTLRRKEWNQALSGSSINVKDLAADSRMKGVDVAACDLDKDGKISGARETDALFVEIDRGDNDPKTAWSMETVDKNGKETDVAKRAAAVGDLGKAAAIQRKAKAAEPGNDDLLFIGMRDVSINESQNLKGLAKGGGFNLTVAGKDGDSIEHGGKTYDLSTDDGRKSFAESLGLDKKQTAQIKKVLDDARADGRNELAALAIDWAKAEKGGRCSSRIMFSGHHAGGTFWGERGHLEESDIAKLAKAMPKAAAQVEDIHLAGCYTGGYQRLESWRTVFPNLQTAWGYEHSSPDAGLANGQQTAWEVSTRGRVGILDRRIARGVLAEEVTVWSRQGGHQSRDGNVDISTVRADVRTKELDYDRAFDGRQKIDDPHAGPVRQYYNSLNNLANHPDLPTSERDALNDKIERTIRLLYFGDVAKGWAKDNDNVISKGYAAAGLEKPDYSKMDRAQALAAIDKYLKATEGSKDKDVIALRAELVALRDLDPKMLKANSIR
jgi:hypothetical protein